MIRSILTLVFLLGAMQAAVAQEWAGTIKSASGSVSVERNGRATPIALGDRVMPADTLVTGKDGRLSITLRDDTLISIGTDTRVALSEFSFTPSTNEGSLWLSVQRGVAAIASGLIARFNPKAMRVSTPSALLGIRGTEFVVEVPGD
jgi:hypothetical protein